MLGVWLTGWMEQLADRLRLVRTCYGHWSQVCDSQSTITALGLTGVFLDPPYLPNRSDTGKRSRDPNLYTTDQGADLEAIRDECLNWCRFWGGNPNVRAAVCGLEGDAYEVLERLGWTVYAWKTSGGYGNQKLNGERSGNAGRERVWFSPACLPV